MAVDEGGKEEEGEGRSRGKERGLPSPLLSLFSFLSRPSSSVPQSSLSTWGRKRRKRRRRRRAEAKVSKDLRNRNDATKSGRGQKGRGAERRGRIERGKEVPSNLFSSLRSLREEGLEGTRREKNFLTPPCFVSSAESKERGSGRKGGAVLDAFTVVKGGRTNSRNPSNSFPARGSIRVTRNWSEKIFFFSASNLIT